MLMGKNGIGNIILDGKRVSVRAGATDIRALLKALGISPQEALVKVNGKVRPEGTHVSKGDSVEVIRVVFGG